MPSRRNSPEFYDAKDKKPAGRKEGVLKLGALEPAPRGSTRLAQGARSTYPWATLALTAGLALLVARRRLRWISGA